MAKIFKANAYLPPAVSRDGKTVTLGFVDQVNRRIGVTLPSPVNAQLIADLQNADALARDRFLGTSGENAVGGATRRTVRQPNKSTAIRDAISGHLLLVMDDGLPTEMTFQIPLGPAETLAQEILRLARLDEPTPTKQ